MKPRLSSISSRGVLKALQRAGFYVDRQSGSHVILKRDRDRKRVTVPYHAADLYKGVVHSILAQAGMTVQEFLSFL